VEDGWTAEGGFVYTTDQEGRPVVADRLHWVVAEAIAAAATLHSVTSDEEYDAWHRRCWQFADRHLIDRERGSWHHELDAALRPSHATWSGKPDVYHALQATLIPRLPVRPSVAAALTSA
jgi:sulfoquinovose isomerase